MTPLTERDVRSCFVNCTKGEATRLFVPLDLPDRPWPDLDYLGWRDPRAPARGYLVTAIDGALRGVALRVPQTSVGAARKSMCSLCVTVHSGGVALMVAPRAGRAGQNGNTVGTYVCADLQCSAHIRREPRSSGAGVTETLTVDERAARLRTNLTDFVARVCAAR